MQEQLTEIKTRLERHEHDTRNRFERLSERQVRLESNYMEVTRRLEKLEGLPSTLEQMSLTIHTNFNSIAEQLGRLEERTKNNQGGISKTWSFVIGLVMLVLGGLVTYVAK